MNDEIKEILDYLKDEKWDYYPSDMTPYKVFFMEERDKLLDYITNLQNTKEYLGEVLHEQDLELEKLKQENEKLLKIKKYAEAVGDKRNELYERIEKAVEYINEHETYYNNNYYFEDFTSTNDLLNILNGGNNE